MINLAGSNQAGNKVTPLLNSKFKLFTLDQSLKNDIESYVPLVAPFGDYTLQANAVPLLNQKIGTVDTDYPLLAYDESGNHKRAILAGEGIWKWRLYEYQEYDEYKHSESLLLKTIQYIATKEDKRQFRAYVNQNNFKENESVRFDAQLYNNNYEPINEPEASLKIENSNGEKFDFTFSKSNNFYVLDAGRFPAGKYKFTASTSFDGQAHQSSGSFSISRIIKEKFDLTARHDLLSNLAQKTGGEVYYLDRIQDISSDLLSNDTMKPILFTKSETRSILNDWYWLVGAIVLLAIEWFLRRYFGAY